MSGPKDVTQNVTTMTHARRNPLDIIGRSRKDIEKDPTLVWAFDISNDIGWGRGGKRLNHFRFLSVFLRHVHFIHQSIPAEPILHGE